MPDWVTFHGVTSFQTAEDVRLWERLLDDGRWRQVVELGTGPGGFAWWLAARCVERDYRFRTFDLEPPDLPLPGFFERADVWLNSERVARRLRAEPTILLCDTDDKTKDVATFAPLLPLDALLVVHDWGTMIGPEHLPGQLEPTLDDWSAGSMSRCFRSNGG